MKNQLFSASITNATTKNIIIPINFQPTHVRVVHAGLFDVALASIATIRCDFLNSDIATVSALTCFPSGPAILCNIAANSQHRFDVVDLSGSPYTLPAGVSVYFTLEFLQLD